MNFTIHQKKILIFIYNKQKDTSIYELISNFKFTSAILASILNELKEKKAIIIESGLISISPELKQELLMKTNILNSLDTEWRKPLQDKLKTPIPINSPYTPSSSKTDPNLWFKRFDKKKVKNKKELAVGQKDE
ncbi:hypothetical protein ACO2KH_18500 [Leptospira terpstrae]|uniref:hypothetical protein n=1 Tax=Leptospira terpstrae TaxID=293075 RepID=UPI003D080FC8